MKHILNLVLTMVLLTTSSCRKSGDDNALVITKPPVSKDPVVWSYDTEERGLASDNYIYKNTIIQICSNDDDYKLYVIALSLDSGKLVWKSDPIGMHIPISPSQTLLSDYHLCFIRRKKLMVLHAETGEVIWDVALPKPITTGMTEKNKQLFITTDSDRGVADVYKFDLQTGDFTTILEVTSEMKGGLNPRLGAPSYWQHPSGDEILIFGSRGQPITSSFRGDKFAYNMTADSLLWYVRGGERTSASSAANPYIYNNSAVFYSLRHIERINLLDGSVIWCHERHASDMFSKYQYANIVIYDNIVFAKPDYIYAYGIDLETGEELWYVPNTAPSVDAIRVGFGKAWFGSGGISCIDIKTGNQLLHMWKYRFSRDWNNSVAIDEQTGYIYTIASGIMYCLDSEVLLSQ